MVVLIFILDIIKKFKRPQGDNLKLTQDILEFILKSKKK